MVLTKEERLQQIYEEVLNLAHGFGSVEWDDKYGTWVCIPELPLPPQYHERYTVCYLKIPEKYPEVPPDGSYVDPDLDIQNPHFGILSHEFRGKPLTWICAHLKGWRPKQPWTKGNNLITVIEAVIYQLNQLKKVKR
jgi:hypothetical protein